MRVQVMQTGATAALLLYLGAVPGAAAAAVAVAAMDCLGFATIEALAPPAHQSQSSPVCVYICHMPYT